MMNANEIDIEIINEQAGAQTFWRTNPKQMRLLNKTLGVKADRTLAPSEWELVFNAVGITDNQRKVFFDYYGVNGFEKAKKQIAAHQGRNENVVHSDYACGMNKLVNTQKKIARGAIKSILNGKAYTNPAKYKSQLDILSKALGKTVKTPLSKEKWDILSGAMTLSKDYHRALYAYLGLDDGNKERGISETAKAIGKCAGSVNNMLASVIEQLGSEQLKPVVLRLLRCNSLKKQELLEINKKAEQEQLRRRNPRQISMLHKIMEWDVERTLTFEEWEQVFDAIAMNDFPLRSVFYDYYGVTGEEKTAPQIAHETGRDVKDVRSDCGRIWDRLMRNNIKIIKTVNQFYNEEYQSYIPSHLDIQDRNRRQFTLLSNLAGKKVKKLLTREQWELILTAFGMKGERKRMFHLYYGTDGSGERTLAEIAEKMNRDAEGKQTYDCDCIMKMFEANRTPFRNHKEDIKKILCDYYSGKPFDVRSLNRGKQKNLLAKLSGARARKTKYVLTKQQWDEILLPLELSKDIRIIFDMYYGIGHATETPFRDIPKVRELGLTTEKPSYYFFRNIEFDKVKDTLSKFVDANKWGRQRHEVQERGFKLHY